MVSTGRTPSLARRHAIRHLARQSVETVSSDEDRRVFLDFLGRATRRFSWIVTEWVLDESLSSRHPDDATQPLARHGWLNGKYADWLNRRHRRVGHLFQGRFKSILVDEETYFAELLRYVVLNPVRAKMVAHPEDYQWSSNRAIARLETAGAWLDVTAALEAFGGESELARACYRSFVVEKIGSEDGRSNQLIHGAFLGSEEWAKRTRPEADLG